MSDLQARFDQAQLDVKGLSERPSNMTLLRLYALFKQGSDGDAHGDKPGFTDIVGRYKYEAWEGLKGTSQDDARQKYIELVEELKSGATT
ncbi:acyl-CoA-binding protein [Ralstonia solanacearum]|uniref:Acyl-CoA-binding protein (ACBP), Histone acetyltransferase n=1 Tax=Ralstonia solanacearum (strain Po82) TaxID=1031711 RepID=F6G206_RALS8|nr:acyl-CoA-binding protein [Ralstonia solanacearum]AEG69289.1 Acyl-CoA-binding protein (ACBP), Histone acetyltransferase [Ralstonia solanacearum Po82]AMP70406.1 acyl-CoA-binding protein [Ralstonia solanacearum]AMP72679.1 acyl-CoA-binding protein [Ralstonia solanacearum]AYB60810.1 acyl-CoA-binding protein [Ralstonia solanacearum]MBB6587642.1 acyl-CoA-binding protein [Ralstonia solanacearum]